MAVDVSPFAVNTVFGEAVVLREKVVARHSAFYGILVAQNHQDGSVNIIPSQNNHRGQWGLQVSSRHSARHSIIVSQAHSGVHTIFGSVPARHQSRYALLLGCRYVSRHAILIGEALVASRFHSRHDILTGEAIVAKEHFGKHSAKVAANHRSVYLPLLLVQKRHVCLWDVLFFWVANHFGRYSLHARNPIATRHASNYTVQVGASHFGMWLSLPMVCNSHRASFGMNTDTRNRHSGLYSLLSFNPVTARHSADYSLHTSDVRIITNQPRLTHKGRQISLRSAEIRADDGSFTWLASLEISKVEEWSVIRVGDTITLNLYDEIFTLVVDEKEMSRRNAGVNISLSLLAVSPLAIRRERITRSWLVPVNAREAVEELLGSVEWTLPYWTIPAGRLGAEKTDSVSLAQQIVGTAGGVLESLPDGSVVCRPRFSVPVPEWGSATPSHIITDDETISVNESYVHVEIANRIAIANGEQESGADEVEYLADEGNSHQGVIRVYPNPWRPVAVVHTGDEQTILTPIDEQEREETELVSFEAGRGNTRYPVVRIISKAWQYVNLGAVSFLKDNKNLSSDIPEYSLLRITYITRCLAWNTSNDRDEEIQFLVTDL